MPERGRPGRPRCSRILGEARLNSGSAPAARESFRAAVDRDAENWELWVDLALASDGAERRRAIQMARRLNPGSTQVQQLVASL